MVKENNGVVLCGFSKPENAPPNRRIAHIGASYAEFYNSPVYAQLDTRIPSQFNLDVTYVDTEESRKNDPATTLRMAREVAKWAQERGLTKLVIVAAKPHMWRCLRDQRKANRELNLNIEVIAHPNIAKSSYFSWFYKESEQSWCRSVWMWLPRESILFLMPFWAYDKLTG